MAMGQRLAFEAIEVPNPNVTALHADANGFLWVGTRGAVFRYDGKFMDEHELPGLQKSVAVNVLAPGPDGQLLAGSADGKLWRYTSEWKPVPVPDRVRSIHHLLLLRDTLWIAGHAALHYMVGDSVYDCELPKDIRGSTVKKLAVDRSGNLVVAVLYGGYFRVVGLQVSRYLAERLRVFDMALDSDGNIWEAGHHTLRKIGRDSVHNYTDLKQPERNWTNCLLVEGNDIWLGADGHGEESCDSAEISLHNLLAHHLLQPRLHPLTNWLGI